MVFEGTFADQAIRSSWCLPELMLLVTVQKATERFCCYFIPKLCRMVATALRRLAILERVARFMSKTSLGKKRELPMLDTAVPGDCDWITFSPQCFHLPNGKRAI
jgi:hypothetical protein